MPVDVVDVVAAPVVATFAVLATACVADFEVVDALPLRLPVVVPWAPPVEDVN